MKRIINKKGNTDFLDLYNKKEKGSKELEFDKTGIIKTPKPFTIDWNKKEDLKKLKKK